MNKKFIIYFLVVILLIPAIYLYLNDYLPIKYHKSAREVISLAHKEHGINYKKAIKLYKQALRLNPYHPEGVYYDMGNQYIGLKKYEKAIEMFEKADEIYKGKEMCVYSQKGYSYMNLENADKAKENFLKVINNYNDINNNCYSEAYYKMAYILFQERNYKEALKYANKYAELYPQYIDSIINLKGYILGDIDSKEADKFYAENEKHVKNMNKGNAAGFYYAWGSIIDDDNKAIEKYKKAVEFDSSHSYAYSEICKRYARLNNGKEAIKYCEIANKVFPHPLSFENTCYAYYTDKQYEKAKTICNWMISQEYITPNVYYYSALIEKELGNKEEAMKYINKAIETVTNWKEEKSLTQVNYGLNKGNKELLDKYEKLKNELKNK